VKDVAAAVTDTHALLYHAAASPKLGRKAARHFTRAEQGRALVYVPAAVIWEVGLLARGGRFNLRRSVRDFFGDVFSNPAYHPYDLSPAQIFDADELGIHRDPFDALICAAARELGLPLMTRDTVIATSGTVAVLW
jgi:PIN domain nuclease of toxin-antitoxin system